MQEIATTGHNQPPPPTPDEVLAPFQDDIQTARDTAVGEKVANDDQLDQVDALRAKVQGAYKALESERKRQKKPHDDAGKAVQALFKPHQEAVTLVIKSLDEIASEWRREKAEKEAAKKREAAAKLAEAEAKAQAAHAQSFGDADAKFGAMIADVEAAKAKKELSQANKAHTKGLRLTTFVTVDDRMAALKWLIKHDPKPLINFIQTYAERHCKNGGVMDGVSVEKRRV